MGYLNVSIKCYLIYGTDKYLPHILGNGITVGDLLVGAHCSHPYPVLFTLLKVGEFIFAPAGGNTFRRLWVFGSNEVSGERRLEEPLSPADGGKSVSRLSPGADDETGESVGFG